MVEFVSSLQRDTLTNAAPASSAAEDDSEGLGSLDNSFIEDRHHDGLFGFADAEGDRAEDRRISEPCFGYFAVQVSIPSRQEHACQDGNGREDQ
jgi:hypothetical protein